MKNIITKEFGQKISQYRANAGLNQEELGGIINKSGSYISKIESGSKNIDLEDLQLLATAFNVSIYELITGISPGSLAGTTTIKDQITTIMKMYLIENKLPYKGNKLAELIRTNLPNNIVDLGKIDIKKNMVTGSAGKDQWSEIPWICIFDKDITTTAQEGLYLVLLFKADMSGAYLSLNQGWTFFHEAYGAKNGLENIKIVSNKIRELIITPLNRFALNNIKLEGSRNLAKGYEAGHIIGKYYHFSNIPNDIDFINDIRYMLGIYTEIKGIMGNNSYSNFISALLDSPFEDSNTEKTERTISTAKNAVLQISKLKDNKITGTRAEEYIFKLEKKRLYEQGRPDLAEKVIWVSNPENGVDGKSDIESFFTNGKKKYIEVKGSSQRFKDKFTFHISRNKVEYAKKTGENHVLVLVDNVHLDDEEPSGDIRGGDNKFI